MSVITDEYQKKVLDDEDIIVTHGKAYGFNVYQINAQDDDWEEKITNRVYEIQRKENLNR